MLEEKGNLSECPHDDAKRKFSDVFPNEKVDITLIEFQEILKAIRKNEDWYDARMLMHLDPIA